MRHYLLTFLFAIFAFTANAVIIEDFEGIAEGTNLIGVVFQDKGQVAVDLVANPDQSGINTSDKVARVHIYKGAATSGIIALCFSGCSPALGYPVHPDGKKYDRLRFKYYKGTLSDRAVDFEPWGSQPTEGRSYVLATEVDEWEYIEYELVGSSYSNIQFKVSRLEDNSGPAPAVDGDYIYIDDIEFYNYEEGPDPEVTPPPVINPAFIDFENITEGANLIGIVFQDKGQVAVDLVANPDQSGINTSDKVARVHIYKGAATSGIISLCFTGACTPLLGYPVHPDGKKYDRLRFKYYKGDLSDRAIDFEPWGSQPTEGRSFVLATEIDKWEYIEFELIANTYTDIQFKVSRMGDNSGPAPAVDGDYVYIDDIEFYNYEEGPATSLKAVDESSFTCISTGDNTFNISMFIPQSANVRIDLISLSGITQPIFNQTVEGNLEVPFRVESQGLYFVRMTVDNGFSKTMKVISK